jgi:hypothetical protein
LNPESGREFYQLDKQSKTGLNLKGDVSNQQPVYRRSRYKEISRVDRELQEGQDDVDMDR